MRKSDLGVMLVMAGFLAWDLWSLRAEAEYPVGFAVELVGLAVAIVAGWFGAKRLRASGHGRILRQLQFLVVVAFVFMLVSHASGLGLQMLAVIVAFIAISTWPVALWLEHRDQRSGRG